MTKYRILATSVATLVFVAVFQAIVLHRLGLSWAISMADSLISNLILAMICSVLISIFHNYQPRDTTRLFRLFIGIFFALAYMFILEWLLPLAFPNEIHYHDFINQSLPIRFFICFLILAFITLSLWIWTSLSDQQEIENRKAEADNLNKEAELVQLRQQLQPHFLFNSLNSINALIGSRPVEARKMTQQLSDFLRGTLKMENQAILLLEEFDHLKRYLEIEKVRFGNRLQIDFYVEPDSLAVKIPALLLQPLVENAIKFGLYGIAEAVKISLTAAIEGGFLVVSITNPFDSSMQQAGRGAGFGLSSIERRIQLIFGRNDLLTTSKSEGIFTAQLKIPIQK